MLKQEASFSGCWQASFESSDAILRQLIAHGSPENPEVILEHCRKRLPLWLRLYGQFERRSSSSSQETTSTEIKSLKTRDGKEHSLDSSDWAFIRKCSHYMDLNYADTWQFCLDYFGGDYQPGKMHIEHKSHQFYTQSNVFSILKLYFRERVASVQILSQIFKAAVSPQSWFQSSATFLIGEIMKQCADLMSVTSKSMISRAKMGLPVSVLDSDMETIFVGQMEMELDALAELLLWSAIHIDASLEDRIEVLRNIFEFTHLSHNRAVSKSSSGESLYLVATMINLLDIPHSGNILQSQLWKATLESKSRLILDIDKAFEVCAPSSTLRPYFAYMWSGILVQVLDYMSASLNRDDYEELVMYIENKPASQGLSPLFVQYAQSAFGSTVLKELPSIWRDNRTLLLNRPETKLAIGSALMSASFCFLTAFEVESLNIDNVAIDILTSVLDADVISAVNIAAIKDSIEHLFQYYAGLFPAYYSQIFRLINIMYEILGFDVTLFQCLHQLPWLAQSAEDIDPSLVNRVADKQFSVLSPVPASPHLFKYLSFEVKPNVVGNFRELKDGRAVVQWETEWSAWEFMANFLTDLCARPKELLSNEKLLVFTKTFAQLIPTALRKYMAFVDDLDPSLAQGLYSQIFPVILDNVVKLVDFCSASLAIKLIPLLVALIETLQAFVTLYPGKIWESLRKSNLLSKQTNLLSTLLCHCEMPSAKYPITIAFLELLDKLLIETRRLVYADLFQPDDRVNHLDSDWLKYLLDYTFSVVFPGINSWKFKYPVERYEISGKCLSIFNLVLSDPAPSASLKSKKTQHSKSGMAKYGDGLVSVIDQLLQDTSRGPVKTVLVMLLSNVQHFHEECETLGNAVIVAVTEAFKLLHEMLAIHLQDPQRSKLMENLLIPTDHHGQSFHIIVQSFRFAYSALSLNLCHYAIKVCIQVSVATSSMEPRPLSFASVISARFVKKILSHYVCNESSPEFQVLALKFMTSCLHSQIGLAFEILLPKDGNEKPNELVEWIKSTGESLEKHLKSQPLVVCALCELLNEMWSSPAYRESLKQLKESPKFWEQITKIIQSYTIVSGNWEESATHTANLAISFVINILSIEAMSPSSSSASFLKPIYEQAAKSLQNIAPTLNELQMNPAILQELNVLTNDARVDYDAFRRTSWCSGFSRSLEHGKLFVFSTSGIRKTQPTLAKAIENINLEFSLRDSQAEMSKSYFNFLSVCLIKIRNDSVSYSSAIPALVKYTFEPPNEIISERIKLQCCRFLTIISKQMKASELFKSLSIATDQLETPGYRVLAEKIAASKTSYYEILGRCLFLFITKSFNGDGKENEPKHIDTLYRTLKIALEIYRSISSSYSEVTRSWLLVVSAIIEYAEIRGKPELDRILKQTDFIQHVVANISSTQPSHSSADTLHELQVLALLADSSASDYLASFGLLEKLTLLKSSMLKNESTKDETLLRILMVTNNICRINGHLETVAFSAIILLDAFNTEINAIFALVEKESVSNHSSSVSSIDLNIVEQLTELFCLLSNNQAVWRHRYFSFADVYTEELLKIARYVTDILVHPNKFSDMLTSLDTPTNRQIQKEVGGSHPIYRKVQFQLLRILRNIYLATYVLTRGQDSFLLRPQEWTNPQVVFIPVLETSVGHMAASSLGVLNVILAYSRDRLESFISKLGTSSPDKTATSAQLETLSELIQTTFLLFVSQVMFSLHSQQQRFDMRQKEQIRMEATSEILAAIDAYLERFDSNQQQNTEVASILKLLTRLRRFIETILVSRT